MSNLGKTFTDDTTLKKAIDDTYSGTGYTEVKVETAKEVAEQAKQNDLPEPVKPGENWKKPICEVYSDFNKWLDYAEELYSKRVENGAKHLSYSWYKSGADISIFDIDKYRKELFNTDSIQNSYKEYLDGSSGVNGDPIGIKFQSGNILADERAFYIRHATIARSMANGLLQNNKITFLKELYLNHIKRIRETCDKHYEVLHKDRYKKDAEGTNNKKP